MDRLIEYGAAKYKCEGCGKYLPQASVLGDRLEGLLAEKLNQNQSLNGENLAKSVRLVLASAGVSFGKSFYDAGRALAGCQVCWNDFCKDCAGCENHGA